MPDKYETLQCHFTADQDVIQVAYKRLAAKYHPDANSDDGATEKFKAINEAYETLRDPDRRAAYDSAHGFYSSDTSDSNSAIFYRDQPLPEVLAAIGLSWRMSFNDAKFLFLSNNWTITKEDTKHDYSERGLADAALGEILSNSTFGLFGRDSSKNNLLFEGELIVTSPAVTFRLIFHKIVKTATGPQVADTLSSVTAMFDSQND